MGKASGHGDRAILSRSVMFEQRTEGEKGRQVDVWGSGLLEKQVVSMKAMQEKAAWCRCVEGGCGGGCGVLQGVREEGK